MLTLKLKLIILVLWNDKIINFNVMICINIKRGQIYDSLAYNPTINCYAAVSIWARKITPLIIFIWGIGKLLSNAILMLNLVVILPSDIANRKVNCYWLVYLTFHLIVIFYQFNYLDTDSLLFTNSKPSWWWQSLDMM